jgi:hypothetical protein
VRPDNQFTVTNLKRWKDGTLTFSVKLPGAGKLTAIEAASSKHAHVLDFASWSEHVNGARTLEVRVRPGKQGASPIASRGGPLNVKLTVAFSPKGGRTRTVTVRGISIGP